MVGLRTIQNFLVYTGKNIYCVQYYLQFQASAGGLGTYAQPISRGWLYFRIWLACFAQSSWQPVTTCFFQIPIFTLFFCFFSFFDLIKFSKLFQYDSFSQKANWFNLFFLCLFVRKMQSVIPTFFGFHFLTKKKLN